MALKLSLATRDTTCDVDLGPIREGRTDGGRVIHVGDSAFRTLHVTDAFGADVTDEVGYQAEAQITHELWRVGAGPVGRIKRESRR